MATRQKSGSRSELIRCPNCGEDYSATYKRCPFCDEEATRSVSRRTRGGRRLSNTRGGGYGGGWGPFRIVTTLLSVALIVAAAIIVFTIVKPMVELGSKEPGSTVPGNSAAVESPSAAPTDAQPSESPVQETPTPGATVTAPALQTAQSFTLNNSDITLKSVGEIYQLRTTLVPAGTVGNITWTSSNPSYVSVSADGKVTAVSKGTSTITATLEGGYTQKCIVRCNWSDSSPTPTPASSGLTLNRTDITMSSKGETFTLKVSGTGSTPKWTTSNSSVATVSSDGKVTAVSNGTVTVTATVDGKTLKCIVRCNF